jgi:hypothetical protein
MFESQHWYTRQGAPAHFQDGGGPTTLREARTQSLVPSVSTVLSIIAKPQLERWKREQSVMAALTLPRLPDEPEYSFLRRIGQDAARQAQEAAEIGTAIHAAIEASFAGRPVEAHWRPSVSAVHQVLRDNFGDVPDWTIEHRFAHPDGFGGCVDIFSRSINVVGDHKSAAIAPDQDKQLAYDQFWQLGAYGHGLDLIEPRGFNLFVSRTHPGHVRFYQWSEAKMRQGRQIFLDTLRLWKSIKNFDGGW